MQTITSIVIIKRQHVVNTSKCEIEGFSELFCRLVFQNILHNFFVTWVEEVTQKACTFSTRFYPFECRLSVQNKTRHNRWISRILILFCNRYNENMINYYAKNFLYTKIFCEEYVNVSLCLVLLLSYSHMALAWLVFNRTVSIKYNDYL